MAESREVTIVGAGPAGMSAAIYLRRCEREPLLLEMGTPGGLLRQADIVENYPGFVEGIEGAGLARRFVEHLEALGGTVTRGEVTSVRQKGKRFVVNSSAGEFCSDAVIISTGTRPRRIPIEHTSLSREARVFYEKDALIASSVPGDKVAIVGGGDAAFDQAIGLSGKGYNVVVVSRSKPRCIPLLRRRANERGIEIIEGRQIRRISEKASCVEVCLESDERLRADRLLIACGREPQLEMLSPTLRAAARAQTACGTAVPGLYFAGDNIGEGRRQVGIAVGSGISAAMLVERFLRERESH